MYYSTVYLKFNYLVVYWFSCTFSVCKIAQLNLSYPDLNYLDFFDYLDLLLWSQFSCILILLVILWSEAELFFLKVRHETLVWNEFISLQNTKLYAFWAHNCHDCCSAFHWLSSDWLKFAPFLSEISHTISSISVVWRTWAGFCVKTILSPP